MQPGRLMRDSLVDRGDRCTAKLDLDRNHGQGSQPMRARPPRLRRAPTSQSASRPGGQGGPENRRYRGELVQPPASAGRGSGQTARSRAPSTDANGTSRAAPRRPKDPPTRTAPAGKPPTPDRGEDEAHAAQPDHAPGPPDRRRRPEHPTHPAQGRRLAAGRLVPNRAGAAGTGPPDRRNDVRPPGRPPRQQQALHCTPGLREDPPSGRRSTRKPSGPPTKGRSSSALGHSAYASQSRASRPAFCRSTATTCTARCGTRTSSCGDDGGPGKEMRN